MNIKKELKNAFPVPAPVGRREFLRAHRRRELSTMMLVLTEAGYVRLRTWLSSLGFLAVMLVIASGGEPEAIWVSSSLTPALALMAVAEWGRSRRYGTVELELACRTPRRTALLARMVAVGAAHLGILALAAPVLSAWGEMNVARTGAHLLTPYLLTASLGLDLSRRCRGREGAILCSAVAITVCALGLWIRRAWGGALERTKLWPVALIVALILSVIEVVSTLRETEVLTWS